MSTIKDSRRFYYGGQMTYAQAWEFGEAAEEGWFGSDSVAFVASLLLHIGLILSLALFPNWKETADPEVVLVASATDPQQPPLQIIDEVVYTDVPHAQPGAMSDQGSGVAEASAPILANVAEIPSPVLMEVQPIGTLEANVVEQALAPMQSPLLRKGNAGNSATGATGAVDRITAEILESLEERPTLVVWLFDESGSLIRQRAEILDRFDRIYEELGIVRESREKARKVQHSKEALLTSVVSFGKEVHLQTPEPTADLNEIKEAVRSIEQDMSGIENAFSAIYAAADRYKSLRKNVGRSGPLRNVMLIVVSDERGDDYAFGLEKCIDLCRKYGMPVYVIGVPAPFAQEHTFVKYVDPDPQYDQTPHWAPVDQGPETLLPEVVQIGYSAKFEEEHAIDSGFGPFALTRLCVETGGIYFTVHPNRALNRPVRGSEISPFSSRMSRFFDPNIMARYRPDYVSAADYFKKIEASPMRKALIEASRKSSVEKLEPPQLWFVKRDEAGFQQELSRAQQAAAILEPRLNQLYEILKKGQASRTQEASPRWMASYDLSLGRVLAAKVRTETYNSMLAKAKRGMVFQDAKNNTWVLKPANEISAGSKHQREGEEAKSLLEGVLRDHPGTPWAVLAEEEMESPMSWDWTETFTDLNPPRPTANNNNNNVPRPGMDDEARRLERMPPKRPVPKL